MTVSEDPQPPSVLASGALPPEVLVPAVLVPAVLVIGEALVDIVVRDGDASAADDRAPVVHPGGSPLNVAYGLARLGVPTTFRAQVGSDEYGRTIIRHLEQAGVVLEQATALDAPTSTATAHLDAEGRASYEFDIVWELDRGEIADGTSMLHTGSIASVLRPGAGEIRRLFADARARGDVLLSYDPNVRPSITPDRESVVADVEALAADAHVVKLSDEDAEWLYPGVDLETVVSRFLDAGSLLVGVTRGGEGCLLAAPGVRVALPAQPVEVVDTIGAGDSFMSGMLYAILRDGLVPEILAGRLDGEQVEAIARTALESARITVSRAGAHPPSLAELG
ncbi:carbohydrate kinase family protein [Subtercola boreus]|uniref:carbohydrate kinase family protein n=1 Tax=Subtercola boreus TaxID=120213 RepID=UPI00209C1ED3|nr:carbohydrate kinase [Subtercola boreus]